MNVKRKEVHTHLINTVVTLGNIFCNLSHNGTTKVQDNLQEKLHGVSEPLKLNY